MSKRLFDIVVSLLALVVLAPVLLVLALAIKLDSPGTVLFRQDRVGRYGQLFRIHKFRSMRTDAERLGLQLTAHRDPRVTRVGSFLRRHKLDELPQLIDVLRGDMSIVGPRPEVPRYVALYPAEIREVVLSVRPGITDSASVHFSDESSRLAADADPEGVYVNVILPEKLKLCVEYVREHSVFGDLVIVARTMAALFRAH